MELLLKRPCYDRGPAQPLPLRNRNIQIGRCIKEESPSLLGSCLRRGKEVASLSLPIGSPGTSGTRREE